MRNVKHGFLVVLLGVSLSVLVLHVSESRAQNNGNGFFSALDPPQAVQTLLRAANDLSSMDYVGVAGMVGETKLLTSRAFTATQVAFLDTVTVTAVNPVTDTLSKRSGFPEFALQPVKVNDAPAIRIEPFSSTVLRQIGGDDVQTSGPITITTVISATDTVQAPNVFMARVANGNEVLKKKTSAPKLRRFANRIAEGKDQFLTDQISMTWTGTVAPKGGTPKPADFALAVMLDEGTPTSFELGALDDSDRCPDSDLSESLVIGDCDTGVDNMLFDDGCTMSDLVRQCADRARNDGEFVSCVAGLAHGWNLAGFIAGADQGRIVSCAGAPPTPRR